MEWVKTINNAIEYMENHLTDDITLSDIAESVYISAFHFQRAFSMMAGISPAEYLRNRRLSQAGAELANGNERVIDIAMKYGYESSKSFTKAFSRFHGFSPMQVRKGSPLKYMNRYTIRITIDGGSIMEYKIEKWEAMDLLVHVKNFHAETSENEIPAFWDEYYSNEEYRRIPGYLGICVQRKTESTVFQYGIGCKASKAIQAMWDKIYNEWLPITEYELIPEYYIENYLPRNPTAKDYVSEICIPINKVQ